MAAPYFVPFRAFGANERIVTAHIGVGGQGGSNLNAFLGKGPKVQLKKGSGRKGGGGSNGDGPVIDV